MHKHTLIKLWAQGWEKERKGGRKGGREGGREGGEREREGEKERRREGISHLEMSYFLSKLFPYMHVGEGHIDTCLHDTHGTSCQYTPLIVQSTHQHIHSIVYFTHHISLWRDKHIQRGNCTCTDARVLNYLEPCSSQTRVHWYWIPSYQACPVSVEYWNPPYPTWEQHGEHTSDTGLTFTCRRRRKKKCNYSKHGKGGKLHMAGTHHMAGRAHKLLGRRWENTSALLPLKASIYLQTV